MNGRAYALDALRGYAILTMVLSAMVASGILPAWMYHAQTPPPSHVFNPDIPGITWVDMVFPAFLFAMGAAFPFSVKKRFEKGVSLMKLSLDALLRAALLTYFAIFIQHFYPYMLSSPQDMRSWLLAILCFILLFPTFMRIPLKMPVWCHILVKVAAIGTGIILMFTVNYAGGNSFSLYTSNIIILILADMALFGASLYIATINNIRARIAVVVLLTALIMSSGIPGSWAACFAAYTPLPWFYNFHYMKYIIIVMSGSIGGEYLYEWMKRKDAPEKQTNIMTACGIMFIASAMVVINLYCLFTREVIMGIAVSALLGISGYILLRKKEGMAQLWMKLFMAGIFLVALGLFLDPYQGGIKKDPVNFSYLFLTSGLSFMLMIFFSVLCDYFKLHKSTSFLVMSGQNPMIAYVSGSLLVLPVLNITGIAKYMYVFGTSPFMGFMQGIILTGLVVLVTVFFSKRKWFWRT